MEHQAVIHDARPDDASLFPVLAQQARSRERWQLAATGIGGAINGVFFWRHAGLWWVSAAFAATCMYGAWGLADRWSAGLVQRHGVSSRLATAVRGATLVLGVLCTFGAVAGFMGAAFRGWIH